MTNKKVLYKQCYPHLSWQEFSFAGGEVTDAVSTEDEQKSLLGQKFKQKTRATESSPMQANAMQCNIRCVCLRASHIIHLNIVRL